MAKLSPFDWIKSIQETKENLMTEDDMERQYNPYLVNRGLSYGSDTIIYANEMNSRPHIDKRLQYNFLLSAIHKKKRFNKWIKSEDDENLELVQAYFECNAERAKETLSILSVADLDKIRSLMYKGGLANK